VHTPLASALAALLVGIVACRGHDVQRSTESTITAMAAQRGAPQPPPPAVRYDQHIFAGGAVPPAESLSNPYKGDRTSAAQGEKLFGTMNCDGCHGGGGTGWVGPSLSDGRWRYGGSDGAIFQSIYNGRPHGMPAFGGIMSRDGIWKIVTYLQSLRPPADVPTESWR
jgi:cytochrome c oxidase cbb3-type subunit 3